MKKKILFLLDSLETGGAEYVASQVSNELFNAGHQVEFLLLKKKGSFLKTLNEKINIFLACRRFKEFL